MKELIELSDAKGESGYRTYPFSAGSASCPTDKTTALWRPVCSDGLARAKLTAHFLSLLSVLETASALERVTLMGSVLVNESEPEADGTPKLTVWTSRSYDRPRPATLHKEVRAAWTTVCPELVQRSCAHALSARADGHSTCICWMNCRCVWRSARRCLRERYVCAEITRHCIQVNEITYERGDLFYK